MLMVKPNFAQCCSAVDIDSCDCVNNDHISVLYMKPVTADRQEITMHWTANALFTDTPSPLELYSLYVGVIKVAEIARADRIAGRAYSVHCLPMGNFIEKTIILDTLDASKKFAEDNFKEFLDATGLRRKEIA